MIRSLSLLIISLMTTSTCGQEQYNSSVQILKGAVDTQNTTSSSNNIFNTTTITQVDNKTEMSQLDIMMETSPPTILEDIIPIETLFEVYAEARERSKRSTILSSLAGIISTIASAVLISMILRSKQRLTTTYHRILLGVGISDILWTTAWMNFNLTTPKDLSYMVWNARGNLATCTTIGYIAFLGYYSVVGYSCSLNLYFLAAVRYNMKDKQISSKIEKWLHGIPIIVAFVCSTILISNKNINGNAYGLCISVAFDRIPHCSGIENGDIREGFEIPCGRGENTWVTPFFLTVYYFLTFGAPTIILVSLGMMYSFVKKQEIRMMRYGKGALNIDTSQTASPTSTNDSRTTSDPTTRGSIKFSLQSVLFSLKKTFGNCCSSTSQHSKSRPLMNRALMYAFSYLLTWVWIFVFNVYTILYLYTDLNVGLPPPGLEYPWFIFQPLQGLFNLMIFMLPKVAEAKRQNQDISWCSAITKAFQSESSASKSSKRSHRKKTNFGGSKGQGWGGSRKIALGDTPSPNQEVDGAIQTSKGNSSDKSSEKASGGGSDEEMVKNDDLKTLEESNKLWLTAIQTNKQSTFNSTGN